MSGVDIDEWEEPRETGRTVGYNLDASKGDSEEEV